MAYLLSIINFFP